MTQEDLESYLPPPSIQTHLKEPIDPITLLHQQFTGSTILALADTAINIYGSPAMKHLNTTLKTWRLIWDQRQVRDQECESDTFSADPLPFWYLAKLYLVLHFYGELVGDGSEFRVPRGKAGQERWKVGVQDKIVTWLNEFRRQACEEAYDMVQQRQTVGTAWNIGEDSRLVKLMKPL